MVTPVAPSTSNINDCLQCRRHLKAEESGATAGSRTICFAEQTAEALLSVRERTLENGMKRRNFDSAPRGSRYRKSLCAKSPENGSISQSGRRLS